MAAELADDDIVLTHTMVGIDDHIVPDVHTPFGQQLFEAEVLFVRIAIEQNKEPASSCEVFIKFVQLRLE